MAIVRGRQQAWYIPDELAKEMQKELKEQGFTFEFDDDKHKT